MERLIECVPNFSEGRDKEVIDSIVGAIRESGGVSILGVDQGEGANRTVVTFAGSPEAVVEAAFQGARMAGEKIDMRKHKGAHPRLGATDVLPLVPIKGIGLEECADLARGLARRIFTELGIPCYCYEAAASKPELRNLAACRAGEYEALGQKLLDPSGRPDFGPEALTLQAAKSGASVVGARNFLIAVNFNLDTASTKLAKEVALDVRAKGRPKRDPSTGEFVLDAKGEKVMVPGPLEGCKAIGWYIEEYGIAQVSMNITDIVATPLHKAFEEVCRAARARGAEVTGTEIVGLVPKQVLLDAGRYFLQKDPSSAGKGSQSLKTNEHSCSSDGAVSAMTPSEEHLISAAVKAMGLDDLRPFNPDEKILERLLVSVPQGRS